MWMDWKNGLRERAVVYQGRTPGEGDSDRLNFAGTSFSGLKNPSSSSFTAWDSMDAHIDSSRSKSAYTVGVKSAGPDRKWNTADDISSWPED